MADNGHTQREAAEVIGTSHGSVNKWANDITRPAREYYEGLEAYLGIDRDTLGVYLIRSETARGHADIARVVGRH